ncbi:unnamed protein product [Mycena citricolor]|uniref:NmrA-like domain-containing protein n=1 Tax=Mycena citricolor TaxID=2018698 RepID=A0AAD2Q526_9AGAR|nr:unnamed protein product [Mycena citricolor]
MSRPIFSVFGATGTQGTRSTHLRFQTHSAESYYNAGSSVINAILTDGTFQARAITRNPTSSAAQALVKRGVDVVQGDTCADFQTLLDALQGSKVVFLVTVLVAFGATVDEKTQGINVVEAAKKAGVEFLVFSSLPSVVEVSQGKYKGVVHYDHKAQVEQYLKTAGLAHASVLAGSFLENLWTFGALKKAEPGYELSVPYPPGAKEIFTWGGRDVGVVALALAKAYASGNNTIVGKSYPIVNAWTTYTQFVKLIEQKLGVPVKFVQTPPSGVQSIDEMYAAHEEYEGLLGGTSIPSPDLVALGVQLGTLEEFLEEEVKTRFSA